MDDFIGKVNVQTNKLQLETLQELLQKVRASRSTQHGSKWSELLQVLWAHLETGLNKLDDQLLCATCFYTVLELTNEKEHYLSQFLKLVNQELDSRDEKNNCKELKIIRKSLNCHHHENNLKRTLRVVSLMYGMLQSTFVTNTVKEDIELSNSLKLSLHLLIKMAYEYSRYTFIVFKTISSLKKVCGTELQDIIFSSSNLIRLLNMVNHNWENPITGVRDLNKSIFKTLVSLFDKNTKKNVLGEINNFYWSKAKYLMLSEIIEQSNVAVVTLVAKNFWIDGLIDSLHKPGLVSAGADMYFAVVKNLHTEVEWCEIFLNKVIVVLIGNNNKSIENFSNYWCLATFKKFPDLAGVLIQELERFEESDSKLYSSLSILKQANKLGIVDNSLKVFKQVDDSVAAKMVSDRIEHCDPHIRMLQFEIVSVTHGKALPNATEFKLILEYLYNNVNSDCTVLRISMLGNIKFFLTHLHASYSNHTRNNQNFESKNLLNFYESLQTFIMESLNLDGNYQRKLTSIKLCCILLSSLNEMPKKRQKQTVNSGVAMTKFLKQHECLILFKEDFLIKLFSLLKDPADDIRDNTVQLLLDHYSQEITPTLLDSLIKDADNCVKSKFFYQISCGQSIFRLITSLLLKGHFMDTIFKTVDDVFSFAYGVLKTEYELKRAIVKSIEEGKQLHAYLSILLEVLKVTKQNSYELKNLGNIVPGILTMLEDISNQFAWEQQPATSSDFSKMSDMVKSIIASSGYDPLDENDLTKISGLEQIVLNCLWLNVKASCDLASYLTNLFKDDEDVFSCGKCLNIITHVLETSRHKGAIEAAGAALGRAIQYLTSLPEESKLSELPLSLLECKLNELMSDSNMASVTRRGAGLSIMVHRIVSSDMKKGKPLFHHFMRTLLPACSAPVPSPPSPCAPAAPTAPGGATRDEPCALYVHFLTRVVTDSGLASDAVHYSADLADVAFNNLTSTHWQIRNAALQLYGALIPKLIGQKKAAGDHSTLATVACDELRSHAPALWGRARRALAGANMSEPNTSDANTGEANTSDANTGEPNTSDANTGEANTSDANTGEANTSDANTGEANTSDANTGEANTSDANTGEANTSDANTGEANTSDANTGEANTSDANTGNPITSEANTSEANINTLHAHSNIMPVLNLLASLARRYDFDSDKKQNTEAELLETLIPLLGSPIFTVRRLTAKCIFNIFDFETVYDIIIKHETLTENFLHGCLLLVGNYKKFASVSNSDRFLELRKKFGNILNRGNHSYINKRECDKLQNHEYIEGEVSDIIQETKRNRYSPGVFDWANSQLKRHIEGCPWDDIPSILKILLQENDYISYSEYILIKMKTDNDIPKQILLQILDIFWAFTKKFESCVVWKVLYHISTHIELSDDLDTTSIFNYLETTGISYRTRYMLPFLSSIAANLPEKHLLCLSSIIFSLCDPDTSDVDMRYIASLANNEIARVFPKIPDSVKISAIKCAVLLLQDEDEDVRLVNVKFYSHLKINNSLLHPHVCWTKILEKNLLESLLDNPETGIAIIYNELIEVVATYAKSDQIDEYNPFTNDSKNIYFEAEVVKKQLDKLKDDI